MIDAAREQAAWLTNRIAPLVQATGIVPKGLFEIQDVHNGTARPWRSSAGPRPMTG